MRYKSLGRVSLNIGFIVELPKNQLGFIEFPLSSALTDEEDLENKIKLAVENKLGRKVDLQDAGTVSLVLNNELINDPFTGEMVTVEKLNDRMILLEAE